MQAIENAETFFIFFPPSHNPEDPQMLIVMFP